MRITGGKYVRRRISCPPGVIRPAMDMMRESLFSILGDLSGTSFLDLFSGSGCVAIEAASRGASPIHLVELDRGKKSTIEKNLSFVEEETGIFIADALLYLKNTSMKYSVIYADPPFDMPDKMSVLKTVSEKSVLKHSGLFVIHIPGEERKLWEDSMFGMILTDERKYGRSMLLFYGYGSDDD